VFCRDPSIDKGHIVIVVGAGEADQLPCPVLNCVGLVCIDALVAISAKFGLANGCVFHVTMETLTGVNYRIPKRNVLSLSQDAGSTSGLVRRGMISAAVLVWIDVCAATQGVWPKVVAKLVFAINIPDAGESELETRA
jgi:hypothetical protein